MNLRALDQVVGRPLDRIARYHQALGRGAVGITAQLPCQRLPGPQRTLQATSSWAVELATALAEAISFSLDPTPCKSQAVRTYSVPHLDNGVGSLAQTAGGRRDHLGGGHQPAGPLAIFARLAAADQPGRKLLPLGVAGRDDKGRRCLGDGSGPSCCDERRQKNGCKLNARLCKHGQCILGCLENLLVEGHVGDGLADFRLSY